MLTETAILRLAAIAKIDPSKFKEAISSPDATEIEIDESLTSFTKTELETRSRNSYAADKKTGEEMLMKGIKQRYGLEVTGENIDAILEALTAKNKKEYDSKPDDRVVELEKTLLQAKETMKSAIERGDRAEANNKAIQEDTKFLSSFPTTRNDVFNDEEFLGLIKSKLKIENRDGRDVVIKDGQPVVHPTTFEPVSLKDAVHGYFTERNWNKQEAKQEDKQESKGGRGGQSSKLATGVYTKLSEVSKWINDSGKNTMGSEGQAMMAAALKENPELDMNN